MSENIWNERYAQPGLVYGTEPNAFLVSVADLSVRDLEVRTVLLDALDSARLELDVWVLNLSLDAQEAQILSINDSRATSEGIASIRSSVPTAVVN